ncbi:MAG: lysophospholipase [Pseudomonadota bacterium]|nr:lysophospholipase [Pseudomonadota bacterium]
MAPLLTKHTIVQTDGTELPYIAWLPDARPRAAIIALHGFNDYSGAFVKPGAYWAARGIATYAYDQRGFGGGPHKKIWAGHETMVDDLITTSQLIRSLHPDTPIFVLGESMGGAVAMIADAGRRLHVEGLILAAPALRGRKYIGTIPSLMLDIAFRLVPGWRLTGRSLRIQASDNIPMLRRLNADPMVIKGTRIDTLKGLVDTMDVAIAAAAQLNTRTFTLYGGHDELVPRCPILDAILAMPRDRSHRSAVYPAGWHMLLRDLKAQIVMDDILGWISDPTAPLPSGAGQASEMARHVDRSTCSPPNR